LGAQCGSIRRGAEEEKPKKHTMRSGWAARKADLANMIIWGFEKAAWREKEARIVSISLDKKVVRQT
jgi:hypothetical protein